MLLSKEVEVTIGNNYKHYLSKGYSFPTYINEKGEEIGVKGNTIVVKVEDLPHASTANIVCTCDFCGKELINTFHNYNNQMKKNGFIRCASCAVVQRQQEKRNERIKNGETFENECKKYNLIEWVYNWDYEKNTEDTPSTLFKGSYVHRYFKCDKGLHESFTKPTMEIVRTKQEYSCPYCNSLGQYLLDEFGEDGIKMYWSEKNEISPFDISKYSGKKVYFKCIKTDYHDDYLMLVSDFVGRNSRCPQCNNIKGNFHPLDSFGSYLEKNNMMHLWSEKNTIDPYSFYMKSAKTEILMKCEKTNYHGDYLAIANTFYHGKRCPYCASVSIHPKDSFGQYCVDTYGEDFFTTYWSDKNTLDPFTVGVYSKSKIWVKCQNDKSHEDYELGCANFKRGNRCPACKESKGERKVREYFVKNNIEFEAQKTFADLIGDKNKVLPYDFYLPQYNILIEYQGEHHYMPIYYSSRPKDYCEEKFLQRQEYDRRKREYAESHNITLLENPYWEYDNVDSILAKALNITNTNTKDNDTNDNNNINNFTNINTYKSSSDNIYTKVKVNKNEFDFPTVEEIMKM